MTGARLAQTGAPVGLKVPILRQCASCASPLRDWQLERRKRTSKLKTLADRGKPFHRSLLEAPNVSPAPP